MLRPCGTGLLLTAILLAGCSDEKKTTPPPPLLTPARALESSLHNTGQGMRHFYEAAQGGFERLTGVSYDQLSCRNCHAGPTDCAKCHVGADNGLTEDACLACHGRQAAERRKPDGTPRYTDVHVQAGMKCWDCHDATDVHGDGRSYNSMLETGAIRAQCENCHPLGRLPNNAYHAQHKGNIGCSACHMQGVVTCYNCHLNTEIDTGAKVAMGQFAPWKFLVQRTTTGKIEAANFMTLVYDVPNTGDTKGHVVIAPFYGHTVARNAVQCDDCHDNPYVREYESTGKMTLTTWDDRTQRATPNLLPPGKTAIIPVPEDWRTAFQFVFGTIDQPGNPPTWKQVTPSEVGTQMLFAEPLDELPD
jgi:hypothetical protein